MRRTKGRRRRREMENIEAIDIGGMLVTSPGNYMGLGGIGV